MLRYPLDSRRAWRLRGAYQDYLLVRASELMAADVALRRLPAVLVLAELESWLSSPSTARTLYELCETLTGRNFLNPQTLEPTQESWQVRACLSEALNSGRLVALGSPLVDSGRGAGPGLNSMPRALAPSPTEPLQAQTWVEIKLVEEDGKPVAGERYSLLCADGSTREGALNAEGYAREEGIPPGLCKVTFPDLV